MPDDMENQVREPEPAFTNGKQSPNLDHIQDLANYLISHYCAAGLEVQGMEDVVSLGASHLRVYESWLAKAHTYFREASKQELTLAAASEWILDNYYMVRRNIHQIEEDLPVRYYQQLPKLSAGTMKGYPRIYAIAQEILSFQNYLLNMMDVHTILIRVQESFSLTMGEIWAFPIFLRYYLIEILAYALESVIPARTLPPLPAIPFQGSTLGESVQSPQNKPGNKSANESVANAILSLRTIAEENWNDFFESVSLIEQKLREDPAGIYPLMDFKTRDRYRREIELLAFASGREEPELAKIIIDLASNCPDKNEKTWQNDTQGNNPRSQEGIDAHVGHYLLGDRRLILEESIGYHPDIRTRLKRWGLRHASAFYLGTIGITGLFAFLSISLILFRVYLYRPASVLQWLPALLLALALMVPTMVVCTSLVNWLVTLVLPPRILPKLNFKDKIPDEFQTLVVVPALITSHEEIDHLVHQLELHYLRNPEPGLRFALLTDFRDADSETLTEDEDFLRYAAAAIASLNARYQQMPDDRIRSIPQQPFFLFHRRRLWNPSERKWMGWERKRGKLHELNLLLRGEKNLSFLYISATPGENTALKRIHYVITLDADTVLPRGIACRLVGTLAHPLNQARFDESTGRVKSGYTVLQPRMEANPRSINHSWFTRIYSGDAGLDLYTLAVSDAYQDLLGEGSYVGKGIYDVNAFERSVDGHIPENCVLSHDLLEGIMGRAGLVTDITMIEDYPPDYFVQVQRQQRWIRGDWQLLPWLFRPRKFGVRFSAIDRWKILDNLVRSIMVPDLVLIYGLGLAFRPEFALFLTGVILLSLGIPLVTGVVRSAVQTMHGESVRAAFHPLSWDLARWLLAIALLPYEAYNVIDAILTTLYRLLFSRLHLLQWTTAAQTARLFGLHNHRFTAWLKLIVSTLMVVILVGIIPFILPDRGNSNGPIMQFSVVLLWIVSPLAIYLINQPFIQRKGLVDEDQIDLLHQVARRTWGFFEHFVGPEDHWLPPDHFQENPVGIIAHHTSPTNIGLLLTSTLAAYDLGYLDQLGLATRLAATLETLDQMERYRGHFLNWYDTSNLRPLQPRYVSTVDSGNLAASLIVTAQACRKLQDDCVFRWELWQGYLDTLSNLGEILAGVHQDSSTAPIVKIIEKIAGMKQTILTVRPNPGLWYALYLTVTGEFWQNISKDIVDLVKAEHPSIGLETLRKLQEITGQVERQHLAMQRIFLELLPWIPWLKQTPDIFLDQGLIKVLNVLKSDLPDNLSLGQIRDCVKTGLKDTAELRDLLYLKLSSYDLESDTTKAAIEWLEEVENALSHASEKAEQLIKELIQTATSAENFIGEMDFQFLYHPQKRVFHNGFNLDVGQLDNNCYDLLASEARIASIVALAKGEVPQSHWLQLSRPLTRVRGKFVLLSWSATMFEYLMPPLFMRSYPGTLLADSIEGTVQQQIAYAKSKGVPWGISESGYYQFDADKNYQYRAFGVPGLGFKRGLSDDLVISPYASLMAVNYEPDAVARNLTRLMAHHSYGLYGFYEAIDFTSEHLPMGDTSATVNEYMAHHQGMILMAMANYFHNDIMVRRMHSDPRIQSVELLLQEQIPWAAPLQDPYTGDVKGTLRLLTNPSGVDPWIVPVQTAIPQVHLLSNGTYNVLISNMGGGYSAWRDIDLTRWQADGVLDPWGTWVYIQDLDLVGAGEGLWSAGYQPVPQNAANCQVTFSPHMAVFRRTDNGITSMMEVTVYPDDPVEIRRIHLHNSSDRSRHLRLTSYGEVILAQQAVDSRHPAFNKLFIDSEFLPEFNLQLFTRRSRSKEEKPVFMGHMIVVEQKSEISKRQTLVRHESDRNCFIGRGRTFRNPAALFSDQYLSGTPSATLDPIFALGLDFSIHRHESLELAYITIAGESRESVLALAERYSNGSLIERSFEQADIAAQTWLDKQKYDTQSFKNTLQVLSALIYPFNPVRASPDIMADNRLGQAALWRFGISGDYPIMLVELDDPTHIELVREVLQIHEFLRSRRFLVDIVLLNYQRTDYGAEMNGLIYRLIGHLHYEQRLNQRGGIFILHVDQINSDELILLQTACRFLFKGERGALNEQMPPYPIQVHHLPELIPTPPAEPVVNSTEEASLAQIDSLRFFNGYGGFSRDGREYILEVAPRELTPAPWINVIGYPNFGFMVSEAGSQSTWVINSGENRLTPWYNDPVRDMTGEVLYLRDEETGEVWTPTPLPAGVEQPYQVTHGAGYTIFDHHSHGLHQRLTLFASPEDPVKIFHLEVKNTWSHPRRITATQYVEWALGLSHAASMPFIISEYDAGEACLLATNAYNAEFGDRVAFLIGSKPIHGLTADRTEFLGRGGTLAFPAALRRIGLETRLTPGEDACAALQVHLDLLPGGSEEIYFVLGQGSNKEQALKLAQKYHDPAHVGAALERTHAFWDRLLGTIQVRTPDPAIDVLLNRWLLYQALSCRVWARSAFYQPSGAFGFRDQLQDVLALLPIDPAITRGQILNAAMRQFGEGDVLHWWHPPSGRGVRTRISDDLLWLPYGVALYIETTGDWDILEEKIPFLEAPPLKKDESERYQEYLSGKEAFPLIEHCYRAIAKGATHGPHGLPLIGTGDWNDGLNRVGRNGNGESVWLAWFLCDVLERFARICDQRGEYQTASRYRSLAKDYATSVEQSAWDGAWYHRAYYDDGSPMGSRQGSACQIDAIAQSWSVLSGAGDAKRSRQAMQSVMDRLVLSDERLSLIFTPPFDKTEQDPGYIQGYPPGVRENGGQYTHAAIWSAWAMAALGDGQRAGELFSLLNPIYHSDSKEKADEYRVEPYVMAADIYSRPPFAGRGGWTWYTGSAAWMYRLGLTGLLGFKKDGDRLRIEPVIPPEWDGYEIGYIFGSTCYTIIVSNLNHVASQVQKVTMDGKSIGKDGILLVDDRREHRVDVIMGD